MFSSLFLLLLEGGGGGIIQGNLGVPISLQCLKLNSPIMNIFYLSFSSMENSDVQSTA